MTFKDYIPRRELKKLKITNSLEDMNDIYFNINEFGCLRSIIFCDKKNVYYKLSFSYDYNDRITEEILCMFISNKIICKTIYDETSTIIMDYKYDDDDYWEEDIVIKEYDNSGNLIRIRDRYDAESPWPVSIVVPIDTEFDYMNMFDTYFRYDNNRLISKICRNSDWVPKEKYYYNNNGNITHAIVYHTLYNDCIFKKEFSDKGFIRVDLYFEYDKYNNLIRLYETIDSKLIDIADKPQKYISDIIDKWNTDDDNIDDSIIEDSTIIREYKYNKEGKIVSFYRHPILDWDCDE